MKKKFLLTLVLFGLGSLSAQSLVKHFNPSVAERKIYNSGDTLKILAVMVEFQEDKYDATIGTGKFGSHYTQAYGDTILDPLPHDAGYFSDHLQFAKNYFYKVSNGKLNITYRVLPEVITVSQTMRNYTPPYNSHDLLPLGKFAEEVWQLANQKYPQVDYGSFDLFIVFRAGVSGGLDDGTLRIDRNLPSLYLSTTSLKKIFGPQFKGFPVNNGSAYINNTIILPETESREYKLIDGSVTLLELTINGQIVANIASHLGLPDLFNTETSKSAIGRFGLMDGQAIIANAGMFPPEPSPWEKILLGWAEPKVINLQNSKVNLVTKLAATGSDTTLLKIPINATEYFLVENRSQDARKDSVRITFKNRGRIFTQIFEPDTNGYFYVEPDSFNSGVAIDVDEFDAALPGSGVVIWHIDEKIINEKLADNKINADIDRKGVDVEEADGIQDIGESFISFFGEVLGEGSYEDFWFKGNKAKFYKNRFSFDTKPNTNTNDGAKSLITLENFAPLSNKISFDVKFGSVEIAQHFSFGYRAKSKPNSIVRVDSDLGGTYLLLDGKDLVLFNEIRPEIKTLENFSKNKIAVLKSGTAFFAAGTIDNIFNLYSSVEASLASGAHYFDSQITTAPVLAVVGGQPKAFFGTEDGKLVEVYLSEHLIDIKSKQVSNLPVKQLAVFEDYYSFIAGNLFGDSRNNLITLAQKGVQLVLTKDAAGELINIVLGEAGEFFIIAGGKIVKSFKPAAEAKSFSIADLFSDGMNYILFNSGSNIYGYNFNGILARNFPITAPDQFQFIGEPLALDLFNDGQTKIISYSQNGVLFGADPETGKLLTSFLFTSQAEDWIIPNILELELPTMGPRPSFKPLFAALNKTGVFSVWSLSPIMGKGYWTSQFGSAGNTSFVIPPDQRNRTEEYFPADKAYNWPNPVYGIETNIRYYVSEDSDVRIKIFDLAGALVSDLRDKAVGGMENETVWNVEAVQSGVYYARLELTSGSGKSASKIIKIAIIK